MRASVLCVSVVLFLAAGFAAATSAKYDELPLKNWEVDFAKAGDLLPHSEAIAQTMSVPSPPSHFIAILPCRVVDTRNANGPFGGPKLTGGTARSFAIPDGPCPGIPATAGGYSFNVTVFAPEALGFMSLYPTGSGFPGVSTLNYNTGETIPNAAIVPAGGGSIDVLSSANAHVIIDINGYFANGVVTSITTSEGLTGGGAGAVNLSIADGGVTAAKLSTAGSTAGQVLTSNGAVVQWQTGGAGPPGPTGPTGPTGPAGTQGVVNVQQWTGPVAIIIPVNPNWVFAGPVVQFTITSGQRIIASASAALALYPDSVEEDIRTDVCYQLVPGGVIQSMNGGYLSTRISNFKRTYSASNAIAPVAGTYNVGFCVSNPGPSAVAENQSSTGWAMVVNP